jgi:hypothetical protein
VTGCAVAGQGYKHNLEARLCNITSSTLFGGALQDRLKKDNPQQQHRKLSVIAACSSSSQQIQDLIRCEGRQVTGFTEEQLQQILADPAGVLHLEYNTFKSLNSREPRPKVSCYVPPVVTRVLTVTHTACLLTLLQGLNKGPAGQPASSASTQVRPVLAHVLPLCGRALRSTSTSLSAAGSR